MIRRHFDWTTDTPTDIWLEKEYPEKLSDEKREELKKIVDLAYACYPEDEVTPVGENVFYHLIRTSQIIEEIGIQDDAIFATLGAFLPIYDKTWKEDLTDLGMERLIPLIKGLEQVRSLTDFVKVDNVDDPKERAEQAERMRKMILAMVDDIRTVIIKLAMRTRTMQYLGRLPDSQKKREIAKETLDIFAPLANRLGLWMLKWQLEDLGFRYQYPQQYREIADELDGNREERIAYIDAFAKELESHIKKEGIRCEVKGRPKHIYSIWRKMQKKKLTFDQLFDIRAVRVLVDTVQDCYTTLGIVHNLWQPISGEFDDYISHPKANDYRSIHTVVVGPEDKGVEIQIRTFEMHHNAEYGVAAHWKYKEGGKHDEGYEKKIAWLRSLLDWRDNTPGLQGEKKEGESEDGDDEGKGDIAENFKKELFQETIYVLSPKGKVISLPYGSTPIDFAYALHTEVGHRCRGALVDGKLVPLFTKLETGQRVEILTSKTGRPSIDWLQDNWAVSSKAISKIKAYLKSLNVDEKMDAGRDLLEKRVGIASYKVAHQKVADKLGFKTIDDLCLALGRAEITVHRLDKAIKEIKTEEEKRRLQNKEADLKIKKSTVKSQRKNGIIINGESGIYTTLAKCCTPAPPDEIVGFITRDKGVSIHRKGCSSFAHLSLRQPEKVVSAEWNLENPEQKILFSIQLEVMGQDRTGVQAKVFECFTRHNIHITQSNSQSKQGVLTMRFTIEIRDSGEMLKSLMNEISMVNDVFSVKRL